MRTFGINNVRQLMWNIVNSAPFSRLAINE